MFQRCSLYPLINGISGRTQQILMSSSLLRYFRDCYEEDNRRSTVWNIFGPDVEHRIFIEGREDILTGEFPHTSVDPEAGEQAEKRARIYLKERELLYTSLFITGTLAERRWGQQTEVARTICAPLLMYPARFHTSGGHLLVTPDPAGLRLNHPLLRALAGDQGDLSLCEAIAGLFYHEPATIGTVMAAADLLDRCVSGLNTGPLAIYPALEPERGLRELMNAARRSHEHPLCAVPASVVALVRRAGSTQGVLAELDAMAASDERSPPLAELFGGGPSAQRHRVLAPGRVPAVLSRAQEQVVASASKNPLTLVIGPPGTGKSYTIAALAVEHLSRGETVLIASGMNQAVDVVGDKIETRLALEGCVVRGGRSHYLKELKGYLDRLLGGIHTAAAPAARELKRMGEELARLDAEIARLEKAVQRHAERELEWGARLAAGGSGLLGRLRRLMIQWRLGRSQPLWELAEELERRTGERLVRQAEWLRGANLRRLHDTLVSHREELSLFSRAIRARTSGRQAELFQAVDLSVILRAFPIWLVNLADISNVLPLGSQLFDVAIIDEATQCDIASSLPVMARAKRCVVVGDPNQLRHISFLGRDRQRLLASKHGLSDADASLYDYREKSVLDLVNERIGSQETVMFLDEHYRSLPPIISFSNARLYGGALHLMTDKPGRSWDAALSLHRCAGRRCERGVNVGEAEQLLADLAALVNRESGLPPGECSSIGVISPFRSQADYLAGRLGELLGLDVFDRHRILIGTAHTFQGEERDVVFLSLAVDPASHAAALRYLNRADVFNVAITRARSAMHIYSSVDPVSLDRNSIAGAYLHHVVSSGNREAVPATVACVPSDDPFAAEVAGSLQTLRADSWRAAKLAGITLDVAAAYGATSCCFDLVGYPGPLAAMLPLERYRMFARAGLRIVPLSYARWVLEPEESLKALKRGLGVSSGVQGESAASDSAFPAARQ